MLSGIILFLSEHTGTQYVVSEHTGLVGGAEMNDFLKHPHGQAHTHSDQTSRTQMLLWLDCGELRLREVKKLAQGHTAKKWHSSVQKQAIRPESMLLSRLSQCPPKSQQQPFVQERKLGLCAPSHHALWHCQLQCHRWLFSLPFLKVFCKWQTCPCDLLVIRMLPSSAHSGPGSG